MVSSIDRSPESAYSWTVRVFGWCCTSTFDRCVLCNLLRICSAVSLDWSSFVRTLLMRAPASVSVSVPFMSTRVFSLWLRVRRGGFSLANAWRPCCFRACWGHVWFPFCGAPFYVTIDVASAWASAAAEFWA